MEDVSAQWQRSRPAAAGGPPPSSTRSEFGGIYDRMGQLMNFTFGLTPTALADMPWVPAADLSETDDAYVAQVDLPAVNKDQVTRTR
jgi:HSP20 family molecular chaperone IbpA